MFRNTILALALGLIQCLPVSAAGSDDWRGRTIYQVMTDRFARTDGSTTATCNTVDGIYCGGSWQGLINKLDYIQGMGFDSVWISPVTKQVEGNTADGSSYHGYWQTDLNNLNSHFGSESDLKNLASELHSRNMYLMVDIVTNHYGWIGSPSDITYSDFAQFNNKKYFHDFCKIDYEDTTNMTQFQQCWEGDEVVPLPDIRTEDADVRNIFSTWISGLISEYSIDGLRIDSVTEVETDFWAGFQSAAGVYSVGEVDDGVASFVCNYQSFLPGVMNYGMYFPLVDAFKSTSGSISGLTDAIDAVKGDCHDTSLLGTFSENHDQPRFASLNGDVSAAKNVLAFTMLTDGIPIVYQGQEQHYNSQGGTGVPFNREAVWLSGYDTNAPLYQLTATLNKARTNAMNNDAGYLTYRNYHIYSDNNNVAMRKGQMVTVLSNLGSSAGSSTLTFASGYAAGTQVTELLTCNTLTADSNGDLAVPMSQGLPRIYYPSANITSSGLCASSTKFMPRQASKFWAPIGSKI